jgi:hypothetical protein
MFNVCYNCGLYRADKLIDPAGPYAICPECGHRHPFGQLPLFIVGGASGSGKSTLCQALTGAVTEAVLLDAEISCGGRSLTGRKRVTGIFLNCGCGCARTSASRGGR